jgi:hypothetical protein
MITHYSTLTIHSQYINVTIIVKCKFTAHYQIIRKHTFTPGTKFIIFAGREMICPFLSPKRDNNESFLPIQSRQILLKFNAIIINVNKYHYLYLQNKKFQIMTPQNNKKITSRHFQVITVPLIIVTQGMVEITCQSHFL